MQGKTGFREGEHDATLVRGARTNSKKEKPIFSQKTQSKKRAVPCGRLQTQSARRGRARQYLTSYLEKKQGKEKSKINSKKKRKGRKISDSNHSNQSLGKPSGRLPDEHKVVSGRFQKKERRGIGENGRCWGDMSQQLWRLKELLRRRGKKEERGSKVRREASKSTERLLWTPDLDEARTLD